MNNAEIKILIAEDNPDQIEIINFFLRHKDFQPDTAQDGTEAIARIQKKIYDVIVTDYKMPGASGLDVIKAAKTRDPWTQVIIVTGHAEVDIAIEALRLGVFDFLQKPFTDVDMLVNIIYRCAEKRFLVKENFELAEKLKKRNTELEEALRIIEAQQQRIIHSERLKALGVMSAGMAHELNNPLTFVASNIQIFEKYFEKMEIDESGTVKNPEMQQKLFHDYAALIQSMKNGISRITTILNGLRAFARTDRKSGESVLISKCVDDALTLCKPKLTGIKYEFKRSGKEIPVTMVYQQLVQAFVNIITNACDAVSKTEDPVIGIRLKSTSRQQNLTITDNGCGMGKDVLSNIFNPFYTTKDVNKGTGIGLSITHGIIKKSGGRITASSAPGEGSTFTCEWDIS